MISILKMRKPCVIFGCPLVVPIPGARTALMDRNADVNVNRLAPASLFTFLTESVIALVRRRKMRFSVDCRVVPCTDGELGYFAGLLDGEGSLVIGRSARKDRPSPLFSAYISMASTTPILIEWVGTRFGGTVSKQAAKGN